MPQADRLAGLVPGPPAEGPGDGRAAGIVQVVVKEPADCRAVRQGLVILLTAFCGVQTQQVMEAIAALAWARAR